MAIEVRSAIERQYLTTTEVADLLRTDPGTLRYWRHVGKGPRSFRPGRRVLYAVEDVEAWLATERGHAAPGPA